MQYYYNSLYNYRNARSIKVGTNVRIILKKKEKNKDKSILDVKSLKSWSWKLKKKACILINNNYN